MTVTTARAGLCHPEPLPLAGDSTEPNDEPVNVERGEGGAGLVSI